MADSARLAGPATSPVLSTPFVGRETELREFHVALEAVIAGRGSIILLTGEPGIGKTRTVIEVTEAARARGMLVVWGRCQDWEGAPAYWPWLQVLRSLLRDSDAELLRARLGPHASVLAQIVPEIRERLPALPDLPSMEPEQARFRLFGQDRASQSLGRLQEGRLCAGADGRSERRD